MPFRGKDDMTFESFLSRLLAEVNGKPPVGRKAAYRKVQKVNGVVYTGMYLEAKDRSTVSPIVYMEPLFVQTDGNPDIDAASTELVRILLRPVENEESVFQIGNFEYAKKRIVFRLMKAEGNEALLEKRPHRAFLDLAVSYGVLMTSFLGSVGLADVTEEMRAKWEITEEELYACALENSRELLGEEMRSLPEIIGEDHVDPMDRPDLKERKADRFYMLTNRQGFFGATALLYSGMLPELAEKYGEDLYIIPTSVHEVIAVPYNFGKKFDLKALLIRLSGNTPPESLLSNEIYLYDRKAGRIGMIREKECGLTGTVS